MSSTEIADGTIEQARKRVTLAVTGRVQWAGDSVHIIEEAFREAGFVLVPVSHLQTAYALVRQDATDDDGNVIPGRISTAIRSFLEGVLARAEVEPWVQSDG